MFDKTRVLGISALACHELHANRQEGMIFHKLNRRNARDRIFADDADDERLPHAESLAFGPVAAAGG
jgi:hypothetical protein